MNSERIKLIVNNMDLLVQSLKKELEDQPENLYNEVVSYVDYNDVDEFYVEDEE